MALSGHRAVRLKADTTYIRVLTFPLVTTQHTDVAARPLTSLGEDETLFRDSVYEFANREIRPLVREMDEHAKIPRSLVDKLFDLGVMAIEIPEEHGGAGATFFHAVLAVEALSSVKSEEHTSELQS